MKLPVVYMPCEGPKSTYPLIQGEANKGATTTGRPALFPDLFGPPPNIFPSAKFSSSSRVGTSPRPIWAAWTGPGSLTSGVIDEGTLLTREASAQDAAQRIGP